MKRILLALLILACLGLAVAFPLKHKGMLKHTIDLSSLPKHKNIVKINEGLVTYGSSFIERNRHNPTKEVRQQLKKQHLKDISKLPQETKVKLSHIEPLNQIKQLPHARIKSSKLSSTKPVKLSKWQISTGKISIE